MGQNSSRLQEQTSSPTPRINSSSPSSVSGTSSHFQPLDAGTDGSHSSQSRRSSFRKSLLKLVRPLSARNRVNGDTTNSGDVRRSWRNSRRWSKTHNPVIDEESHGPGPSERDSLISEAPELPCNSGKGKQREITPTLQENEDHTTTATLDESGLLPCPLTSFGPEHPSTSAETSSVAADSSILSSLRIGHDAQDDPNIECGSDTTSQHSSAALGEDPEGTLPAPPIPQTSTAPSSLHRQFPPPGTLVVVQGIVHTTDVSRSNATPPFVSGIVANTDDASTSQSSTTIDTPSDQSTSRSRNRLSALLRPRSSSRPVSTVIGDPTAVATTSAAQTESTFLTGSDSFTVSEENTVGLNSSEATQVTSQEPPVVENRAPLISSSSIDVLGTLLSVAAAATAASLLTGSSEPILSSGLAPPHPSIPSSRVSQSTAPTTSMPNLPSYSPPQDNAGFPDVTTAGRSERMRQAWGTIRERLGLRPSTSPPDDGIGSHRNQDVTNSDSTSSMPAVDGVELGTPIDTRELMLAEMARAFNIGLGLNGLGGLAPGPNPASGHTDRDAAGNANSAQESRTSAEESQTRTTSDDSNATLPPEGSFERFLVDLQVDLRVALTRPDDDSEPESHQSLPLEPGPQHAGSTNGDDNIASPSWETSSSAGEGNLQSTGADDRPVNGEHYHVEPPSIEVRDDYIDIPLLQDVSDSGSESDTGDIVADDDFQSAEQRSTHESDQVPVNAPQPLASGTARIDAAGRINWWRLYRFPPIISPHPDSASQISPPLIATPTLATANDHSLSTSSPVTPLNDGAPVESVSPQVPNQDTPSPPQNSVVPVIVVGLQSVTSEWRPDLPQQPGDDGVDLFGSSAAGGNPDDDNDNNDDLDGWGGQHHVGGGNGTDSARGRGRARGWHSRAADAIRNLRPGRRNAEAGLSAQLPAITPGSRTFLIYVIGGYYPPDHNIVTGGPNILDSFEALLELADLLGQVKPPTASKDEIDKSGLEIINASGLPQYEKDGKVSSNCLDRCLICLDDYEEEDPIRVMSCRHAFHKVCVDEWLQRGRNNCPACRSTGVTTDSHPTTPFPAAMS